MRHDFVPLRSYLGRTLGGYYDLKYYRHCDHLIGNTADIKRYLIDQGWLKDRAWYIPNFVDGEQMDAIERSQFDTPMDAPLLLALGRLHENKAFDVSSSLSHIPNVSLDSRRRPARTVAREQAVQSGVDARVLFLGWRQDIAALLAAADILVCPPVTNPRQCCD